MVIALAATSFTRSLFTTPSPKYDDFLVGNAAYNPSSFESIATVTAAGGETSFTFSSIPSTYKHLQIRAIAKTSQTTLAASDIWLRFNSDSGTNYTQHLLYGDGTSATASGSAAGGLTQVTLSNFGIRSEATLANMFGAGVIDIVDYASTTKNKTIRAFYGTNNNSTSTNFPVTLLSSLWLSTAAISTIGFLPYSGSFSAGTSFALYGIKG